MSIRQITDEVAAAAKRDVDNALSGQGIAKDRAIRVFCQKVLELKPLGDTKDVQNARNKLLEKYGVDQLATIAMSVYIKKIQEVASNDAGEPGISARQKLKFLEDTQ